MTNPLSEKIVSFPDTPGVYLMKGEGDKIIYVGKAKNLRQRVKQYLAEHDTRYQIVFLMKRVKDIDYLITNTEKEALLLENSLIKKHKPRYNIFLKDDKTYVSVKLSISHEYPNLTVTRKIRRDGALYFGPYSSAHACRETVDFIYRHFRLRTCSDHELKNRSRPCLEFQIHRCTAPCVGYVNQEQYASQVNEVRLFLEGKNDVLLKEVKAKIASLAQEEKFEEAVILRDLMQAIMGTLEKQKMVNHGGLHQDYLALYREGTKGMMALLSVRDGSLIDSRYYPFDTINEDPMILSQFLEQFYLGDVFLPDEILAEGDLPDMSALVELLSEKRGKKVVIRSPKRGEKRDMMDLAIRNAQSQYARSIQKELDTKDVLERLQIRLHLPNLPHRMECYDISNISGTNATASRVVFIEGKADKAFYRHYKIQFDQGPNDFEMMREVLRRRFHFDPEEPKKDAALPDLVVIDGGKGQLGAAMEILKELNLESIPIIGIAKGKGEGARSKGLWETKKEEEIYLPNRKNPVILRRGSPELMLLQRIRDESHRFAIKYHRHLREKISKK